MKKIVIMFLMLAALPAQAEIVTWTDAHLGLSLTYPDTWMRQTTATDKERLEIYAAAAENMAHCEVMAEQDGRFKIYPANYMKDIVPRELSSEFWRNHMANYGDSVKFNYMAKGASLGQGYATHVDYQYVKDGQTMRGIAFGSIYYDIRSVVQCSSEFDAFQRWYPTFSSIIKTFGFDQRFHPRKWGDYRNFMDDYTLNVLLPQGGNLGVGLY